MDLPEDLNLDQGEDGGDEDIDGEISLYFYLMSFYTSTKCWEV